MDPVSVSDGMPTLADFVLGDEHDQVWRRHAACRGTPLDMWFPERGDMALDARSICARCPVVIDCLVDAVEGAVEVYGLRGGAGEPARRRLGVLRSDRVHGGFVDDCECRFCSAVRAHVGSLRRVRRQGSPVASFGSRSRCGTAAKYGRGCRCEACKTAKYEVEIRAGRMRPRELSDG